MKTKEKTIKVSPEAYKKLREVKDKTKVPIIHQIDKAILGK